MCGREAASYPVQDMSETYAVVWSQGEASSRLGRLELRADGFVLGGDQQEPSRVWASEITSVRVSKDARERVRDLKTVVVERRDAPPVRIGAVSGAGEILEIAEVLSTLGPQSGGFQTLLVRLPIRPERI